MKPLRIVTLVVSSVGAALAAGWMFQPEPGAGGAAPQVAMAGTAPVSAGLTELSVTQTALLSGEERAVEEPVSETVSLATLTELPDVAAAPEPPAVEEIAAGIPDECVAWLVVTPEPAAMLDMSLYAPCNSGETVAIAHGPLRMTGMLDANGQMQMILPAMAPEAELTVTFAAGETVADMAEVPDFGQFARVVLQWAGAPVVDLHAYANGAGWGEPGHVHEGSPMLASAGFVSPVAGTGPDEGRALVYTFPAGKAPHDGTIQLEAEIAVTPESCGRSFAAEAHLIEPDVPIARRAVRVEMPACDGMGGFVLLPPFLPEPGRQIPDLAALR